MALPDWSVVIPLHNEAEALPELLARLGRALDAMGGSAEVILVDDASTDDTLTLLRTMPAPYVKVLRLEVNSGQLQATLAGIRATSGNCVAVLDGDLQDPPEILPLLARELVVQVDRDVIFATKSSREDGLAMRLATEVFRLFERALGGACLPRGVGSYCMMRRSVCDELLSRQADLPRHANLASILGLFRRPFGHLDYCKSARPHGTSRIGWTGLLREAAGSLWAGIRTPWARKHS